MWRPSSGVAGHSGTGETALAEVVPNETLDSGNLDSSRRPWPLAALTADGWRYIRREGKLHEELYDLRRDPGEQNNVAASISTRTRLEEMRATLSHLTLGPLTPDRFNP